MGNTHLFKIYLCRLYFLEAEDETLRYRCASDSLITSCMKISQAKKKKKYWDNCNNTFCNSKLNVSVTFSSSVTVTLPLTQTLSHSPLPYQLHLNHIILPVTAKQQVICLIHRWSLQHILRLCLRSATPWITESTCRSSCNKSVNGVHRFCQGLLSF
jgi:hypothetical protein